MSLSIAQIEKFPASLAIKWSDEKNSFIDFIALRDNCPCAHCSGENDVFGNNYNPDNPIPLKENSFKIHSIKLIGNYALRIFWKDGHSKGLYTFNFLRFFNEKK